MKSCVYRRLETSGTPQCDQSLQIQFRKSFWLNAYSVFCRRHCQERQDSDRQGPDGQGADKQGADRQHSEFQTDRVHTESTTKIKKSKTKRNEREHEMNKTLDCLMNSHGVGVDPRQRVGVCCIL